MLCCSGVLAVDSADLLPSDTVEEQHHFLTRSHDYVLLALVLTAIALLVINHYRIKSQKALRESEERFRALAERSVVGITVVQDNVFKYVNPRLTEMFGCSERELVGKKGPLDFVHPGDKPIVESSMRRRLAGDEEYSHYEMRLLTNSGEMRDMEIFGSRMIYQGRPAVIATMLDITDRKRTAQELDKAHSDLGQIFNSTAPLYVINKDYTIERVNETFCSYLGKTAEETVGKKCYEVWPGPRCDTPECPMRSILAGKERLIYEREHTHVDGYKTTFSATAVPYRSVDGSIDGMIASFGDITEVKKREEALRESEERARAQFKSIPVPTYIFEYVDGQFTLVDFNDEAHRISKGSVSDRVGLTLDDIVPGRDDWKQDLMRCLKEKKTVRWEDPLPYYFGGWGETRYLSVSFAYSPPNLVLVHTADITARTKAEEALKESESRFRQLAEKAPVGIYLAQGLSIPYTNPAIERIVGYSVEEIAASASPLEFVHRDDRQLVMDEIEAIAKGETRKSRFEVRVIAKSGEMKHLEVFSSPTMYEGVLTSIGTVVDITDRKKAEWALQESEKKFRTLAEMTKAIILIYNEKGMVYANPATEAICEYSADELSKMPTEDLLREDYRDELKRIASSRLAGENVDLGSYEIPIVTKSGKEKWILYSGGLIQYGGRPAVLGTALDITESKEAQAALQRAHNERYEQTKQIAGGVAHEIYNALFPASSTLEKLRGRISSQGGDEAERNRKLIEIADQSVARAIEMTELVTQFSRLDTEKVVEDIDLKALFEEILSDRSRFDAVGTSLEVKIDDSSSIKMARMHAYSLFNNLINNALDAVDEVERRSITIQAGANGKEVKVQISDTGPGIAPDVLPKIFSPFFSTKPRKGTGIGLAICKRIVDIYKGDILVESSLDRGTTFTILLKT